MKFVTKINQYSFSGITNFTDQFNAINGPTNGDVKEWLICPGMDYNSTYKWWGDRTIRKIPHEGLDLVFFKNSNGEVINLNEKFRVPVLLDGDVVSCFDDYLGKTLVFIHDQFHQNGDVLFSIFGHMDPMIKMTRLQRVAQGEPVANIAKVSGKDVCSHLHISLGWASENKIDQLIDWKVITTPEIIRLMDPVNLVGNITKVNHDILFQNRD